MPRSNGQYTLPVGNPVVSNTPIEAAWANTTFNDVAQALTNSLATDGQTSPTANLPMGGFRHTTVGKATALTQYARSDQLQTGELVVCIGATMPTQDNYSATLPLAATTFTQWQFIFFAAPASNVGACTLNINAAGPKAVLHPDGTPTVLGDFVAGVLYGLTWDGNNWRFLNASSDYAALDARYLKKSGGVMSGKLYVTYPTGSESDENYQAAPVVYVENRVANFLGLAGGTLTGSLTLAGDPIAPLQAATQQYVLSSIAGATAGVSSFNTRTGAVALLSADVTTALTFVPYDSANPAAFISGITGPQVVTALGYTPFNAAGGTITGPLNVTGKVTSLALVNTMFTGTLPATSALDFNSGQVQHLTLTVGATTITAINNLPVGSSMTLLLLDAVAGVTTMTWPSTIKWASGPPDGEGGTNNYTSVALIAASGTIILGSFRAY